MILQGFKKRILRDVARYYTEKTGASYDALIIGMIPQPGYDPETAPYEQWLAVTCGELLNRYGVTYEDCIENKDTIRAAISEEKSRNEGEFYTPEIWAVDGREYLKRLLGDQWGKAIIWDASCGSGNLLRTIDYPADKLFMSTLLPEDIELVRSNFPHIPRENIFQCDFLNGIDYDQYNLGFSSKLPAHLREALEQNQPIGFYMNPPYKVMRSNLTDVGVYMGDRGMKKCALDIFHQFMYRIIMLKQHYNLTNLYLGIFGPVTMFHSPMLEPLYNEFKFHFKFFDGMCFDAGEFANTSESVGWVVGYTTWRTKNDPSEEDKELYLDAKVSDNGTLKVVGKRLITSVEVNLDQWVRPKDVIGKTAFYPSVTTFNNFTGNLMRAPEDFLGYLMSSNFVIRATRRACVTSLPNPDDIPITPENFERCVASFVARRCYAMKQNPYDNCQYYSVPNTQAEGYDQWLIDAFPVFMFDNSAHHTSYRQGEFEHAVDWGNRFFPLHPTEAQSLINDPVLLEDFQKYPAVNQFYLDYASRVYPRLSPLAKEFFDHCCNMIRYSLQGTLRQQHNYAFGSRAWDAGLLQLRNIPDFFPKEMEDRYVELLHALKGQLLEGSYRFGFLMKTAYALTEEVDDSEDLDDLEDLGVPVDQVSQS